MERGRAARQAIPYLCCCCCWWCSRRWLLYPAWMSGRDLWVSDFSMRGLTPFSLLLRMWLELLWYILYGLELTDLALTTYSG